MSSDESHLPSPFLSHNVLSADISVVKEDIYHIILNKYLLVVAASGGALCPEGIVILWFCHSCGRQVHTPCSSFLLRKVRWEPNWPAHGSKLWKAFGMNTAQNFKGVKTPGQSNHIEKDETQWEISSSSGGILLKWLCMAKLPLSIWKTTPRHLPFSFIWLLALCFLKNLQHKPSVFKSFLHGLLYGPINHQCYSSF